MADKIKISNVVKFSRLQSAPNKGNFSLWAVENELDANEIESVITFAASGKYQINSPATPTFNYFYWEGSRNGPKFAAYNENDLGLEERKLMISTEPSRFKSYLRVQSLEGLKNIYDWLVVNGYRTRKKGMQVVKKGYLNQLSTRPEDLANHTISVDYANSGCVALGKVEQNCRRGVITSDGKRLIFRPNRIPTFSEDAIQYWKVSDLHFLTHLEEKLSPEFFKVTKQSVINTSDSTNDCILNLEEPRFKKVLQDFIHQQKDRIFTIYPLSLQITSSLLYGEYFGESSKFKAVWPNHRAALAEKFGTPRKKTKFETLKLGLLLGDRLEQVQKVVKALSGQKIVLRLGYKDSLEYFYLGEILSASVIEALILHLKIDYIVPNQKNLIFCEVQEKVTEETLTFIWEKIEQSRTPSISFSGFQLTE